MEIICGIYKITNPKEKIYIGQSCDIYNRWKGYRWKLAKKQPILYNSLKKYGHEKHKFEIIHQCFESELNALEKYYVDLFQTFNSRHGMNCRDGGGNHGRISEAQKENLRQKNLGKKASEETKEKLRNARKGKPAPNKGKHHSDETKNKIRMKLKGRPAHNKGKPANENQLRALAAMRLMPIKDETRKKLSFSKMGGKNPMSKIILNLQTGVYYDSAREASNTINRTRSYFSKMLAGTHKNYTSFIYA